MKDETYMKLAETVSKESKCISVGVGCVLVKDDRVIATGYNGTVSGHINCCDAIGDEFSREEHHHWSNKYEIHAEMNAILHCPVSTIGATAYVTLSPCFNCVKHLLGAGIKRIVYKTRYKHITDEIREEIVYFCYDSDVKYTQMNDDNSVK